MATTEESVTRVYTINLGKAWISPQHRRTDRVVNMIREYATKHMKSTDIKLDQDLNRQIWSRGKTNPPRKVRVKMVKDEGGVVTVSLYEDLPEESAATTATTTIESTGAAAPATVETKEPDITAPAETRIAEESKKRTKPEGDTK
jgi:large subunit ribosomal protein L31e